MPKFVRWETPFTDARLPSALLLVEYGPKGEYLISALVAPAGIDKYPKYRVHFGEVIAFTCMEEMHFPARDTGDAVCEEMELAAYEYRDSTWLKSYLKGEYFLFNLDGGDEETLRHYFIAGGDNNIEVITKNEPVFETIDHWTALQITFTI